MKFRKRLTLIFSYVYCVYCAAYSSFGFANSAEPIKITFINPGEQFASQTGPFWRNVSAYMQAAADDLNIELTILYANRNHISMAELVDKTIASQPDYMILVNEKGVIEPLLSKANDAKIPTFLLLNCLATLPKRSPYKNWLGCISPDNKNAGFQLTKALISTGLDKLPEHKLKLLALVGDHTSQASQERLAGLNQALEAYPEKVELIHQETAMWSEAYGHRISYAYLSRHNEIDIIWAANDPIAKGAIAAAQKVGYQPFNNIFIGGINWDTTDIHFPQQYLSFGGHLTLGGFALVLLYDHYHQQRRLNKNVQLDIFTSNKEPVYKQLSNLLNNRQLGKLNYQVFSQHLTASPLEMTLTNLVKSQSSPTPLSMAAPLD